MKIIDSYITRKFLASYLFVLFSFLGLHLIIDLFSHLDEFLRTQTPLPIVVQYYFFLLPMIFLRTSTFSMPISVLYSLGELNKNNEIISMRASGISIFKIVRPIILFSLLLSSIAFFLQEKVIIFSQRQADMINIQYIKNNTAELKTEHNFVFRNENHLFFVAKFSPHAQQMTNVVIFKENDSGTIIEKIVCQKITYTQGIWKAENCIRYELDQEGRIINRPFFHDQLFIALNYTPEMIAFKKGPLGEYLSIHELYREIKRIKKSSESSLLSTLIIDFHKKIAEPFSHFFLTIGLLGFALEIKKRKVGLSALAGGFIFGFLYYLIFSITLALGKAGILLPSLSAWIAPIFFLVMGICSLSLIR